MARAYGGKREKEAHVKKEAARKRKFRSGQYQKLKSTEKCWQFPIAAANVQAW